MDAETQQAKFEGWAIVDVLGHQRYVGFVTTEAFGQAVMFRVDVPALEERDRESKAGEYVGGRWVPPGTKLKEGPMPGNTKLIGSGSIYMISPCTKDVALLAIEKMQARPLLEITLPEGRTLPPARTEPDDLDGGENGDDECESCHKPLELQEEKYRTDDDVVLCESCYRAIPVIDRTSADV